MNNSNVLIAGCGDVGIRLAKLLIAADCSVWGLRRDISRLPEGITGISADLADQTNSPSLPKEIDAVVYCPAAGSRSEEVYRRTYLLGLQNIISQIKKQNIGVKRFLFVSSTAVYHQKSGEWVDENSKTEPERFSGQIMLEAERCLAKSALNYSSVRFGGIYGPERLRFSQMVKEGSVKVCEEFPQYTNRIHCEDCAGVLQHLLQVSSLQPCYIAVDNAPVSKQEVADYLAENLGAVLPERVNEKEVPGGQNKRCNNALLLESGYQFLFPSYREGYAL